MHPPPLANSSQSPFLGSLPKSYGRGTAHKSRRRRSWGLGTEAAQSRGEATMADKGLHQKAGGTSPGSHNNSP